MKSLFTLQPHESKRLIARAITKLPEVTNALSNGKVGLAGGANW
ncbi:hypothetical protein [Natranaerobius trueperi]|nr:hypothetical protein [Natranaerobius trueperi]